MTRDRGSKSRAGAATSLSKDKYFSINAKLEPTKEVFQLKNIFNEMKIKDLKSYAEFSTGIPGNLQRLCYLDQGDLLDHVDIKSHEIIPGAVINMKVWDMWRTLVEAVASNDTESVFKLGVTADSEYSTPNSEHMSSRAKKDWLAERAFVALYIASHRGNQQLCEKLIAAGANVNTTTPLGRSALHVAAAKGHGKIVDLLLEKGADINAEDGNGDTALSIADKYGHKDCERHLFLFRWQQRAKKTTANTHHDMFAHQYFDSANPVWFKGNHGQVYYTHILPPGEYEGTALNAPKRRARPGSESEQASQTGHAGNVDLEEGDEPYLYVPDEDGTDTRRGRPGVMPPITEERVGSKGRRPGRPKLKVKSFDEWLATKNADHQRQVEARKLQDEIKRREAEHKSVFDL